MSWGGTWGTGWGGGGTDAGAATVAVPHTQAFSESAYRFLLQEEPRGALSGLFRLESETGLPHGPYWGGGVQIWESIVAIEIGFAIGGGDMGDGDRQSIMRTAADSVCRIADQLEHPEELEIEATGVREVRFQGADRVDISPTIEIWRLRFWVQWIGDRILE
jgi:hypothetical protein